jgi:hypothetical protein
VLLNPGGIPNRQYIEGVANLAAFFNASSVAILGGKSLISYFKTFQVLNAPGTFTARLINGHWDKRRSSAVPSTRSTDADHGTSAQGGVRKRGSCSRRTLWITGRTARVTG